MKVLRARCFTLGLLAVAIACWMTSDADAFGRRHASYGSYASAGSYGSYASAGSYGSYASASSYASAGSYASSGSYASYGSEGSHGGGLFARWHARKAARKAARASHASHGSYASTGSYGSAGSYAAAGSHGSYASTYSGSAGSYGSVHYSAPVEYGVPSESSNPPAPPTEAGEAPADSATINTHVPADAVVYVNGKRTTSTGAERSFVSRGLKSGKTYSYELRVEYEQDGTPQIAEKRLQLRAGQAVDLAFGSGPAAEQSVVKTELKLNVPADAKVFLAGAATRQSGEDRVYASTQLEEGQQWNGYTVRVELNRDGEQLIEERQLNIVGGKTYELAIQFDDQADQLALAD